MLTASRPTAREAPTQPMPFPLKVGHHGVAAGRQVSSAAEAGREASL